MELAAPNSPAQSSVAAVLTEGLRPVSVKLRLKGVSVHTELTPTSSRMWRKPSESTARDFLKTAEKPCRTQAARLRYRGYALSDAATPWARMQKLQSGRGLKARPIMQQFAHPCAPLEAFRFVLCNPSIVIDSGMISISAIARERDNAAGFTSRPHLACKR